MRSTIIVILLLLLSCFSWAKTIQVNVLTLSSLPLSINAVSQPVGDSMKLQVTVSKLNDIQALMRGINQAVKVQHGLDDGEQLKQKIIRLIANNKQAIRNAGIGIGLATTLQIHQVPAVVFNKKYIVLGTTDVLEAYQYYRTWLHKQGMML